MQRFCLPSMMSTRWNHRQGTRPCFEESFGRVCSTADRFCIGRWNELHLEEFERKGERISKATKESYVEAALDQSQSLLGPRNKETPVCGYVLDDDASSLDHALKSHKCKTASDPSVEDCRPSVAEVQASEEVTVAAVGPTISSSAENGSSDEEVIPAFIQLAGTIAATVTQLQEHLIRNDKAWQQLRTDLLQAFSLLINTVPILPSFGDVCDEQLAKLLPRVRSLATELKLDIFRGDLVQVEYDVGDCKGVVTEISESQPTVLVRYESDDKVYPENPAEGGIRLAAGGLAPHTVPFHLCLACVGRNPVEALRALELEVQALVGALVHLPVWSGQGDRAGLALRKLVAGVADRAAEARGWLIGRWPAARLEAGQVGEGLPKRGRGVVAARVVRVQHCAARGLRAKVLFEGAAGSWAEWVPQVEWAGRFRADGSGVWPGGGWRERDKPEEHADGGAAAKRRRRA